MDEATVIAAATRASATTPRVLTQTLVPAPPEAAVAGSLKRSRTVLDRPQREPLDDVLLRRVTTIKEGDNVLLRLPSDSVKAVVALKNG